jgi:hypothetical protein
MDQNDTLSYEPLMGAAGWVSTRRYRTLTGDQETSDADIQTNLKHAQTIVESFVERSLEAQSHTDVHYFIDASPVILDQWPVLELTRIDKDGADVAIGDVVVDNLRGVIHHKGRLTWGENITIEYVAGYEECPADIETVLVSLAKSRLDGDLDVTGPASARAVKKDTVYGVSAIEYDTSSFSKVQLEFYPELGPYVRILERYRRGYEMAL